MPEMDKDQVASICSDCGDTMVVSKMFKKSTSPGELYCRKCMRQYPRYLISKA